MASCPRFCRPDKAQPPSGIAGNISLQQQRPVNFNEFELVARLKKAAHRA
ncbi:Hypothetical protein ABZS17I87_00391 [Kosakonia cowanii]